MVCAADHTQGQTVGIAYTSIGIARTRVAAICRVLGLIALTVVIGWLISVLAPSLVSAEQPPSGGCRRVSKIEYNVAKGEYLLISRYRVYVQTGHFWRHHYWHCPV